MRKYQRKLVRSHPVLVSGKTLEEEGSERHRIGQDLEGGRGGWLRGRSSGEAGEC